MAYLFSVLMMVIDWFGLVLRYLLLYLGLVCYLCYSVVWYLGWVVFVSSGLCFGVFGAFLVCCGFVVLVDLLFWVLLLCWWLVWMNCGCVLCLIVLVGFYFAFYDLFALFGCYCVVCYSLLIWFLVIVLWCLGL